MKKNKGITLIALIITIIVMLILVAVSVSILINSGIIGKAQKAKTDTQEAYAREQTLGESVNINGTMYTLDEIVNLKSFTIVQTEHPEQGSETFYYDDSITTWGDFLESKYCSSAFQINNFNEVTYKGGKVGYKIGEDIAAGVDTSTNIDIAKDYISAHR